MKRLRQIQRQVAARVSAIPRPGEGGLRIPGPREFLDWLCAGRADYAMFQARKRSPEYLARKRVCKNIWIGAGLIMAVHPTPAVIGTLSLLATLISFTILDESGRD